MAYTNINVQQSSQNGVTPTSTAADTSNGNKFSNDGRTYLMLSNGGASSAVVTFATPETVAGLAVADLAITVAAGTKKVVGPFPPELFNQAPGATDEGCTRMTFSGSGAADISILGPWRA